MLRVESFKPASNCGKDQRSRYVEGERKEMLHKHFDSLFADAINISSF